MLEEKRVRAAQDNLVRSFDTTRRSKRLVDLVGRLRAYNADEMPMNLRASGVFEQVGHGFRFGLMINSTSIEDRQATLAFIAAVKFYHFDLMRHGSATDTPVFSNFSFPVAAGMDVPLYQSIGWIDHAQDMLNYVWTDYAASKKDDMALYFGQADPNNWVNDRANPYLSGKSEWFTTMTGFADPSVWRQYGYDPDMDSLGPYWMLAQTWNDPDPARVRNALLAVRELNIGTTFIKDTPEGTRTYLVDEFLLLYDYDIRAINMRRKLSGLAPVEVEDYIYDMDLPPDVLPFAVDDIFYPAYVKMCAEMGVAPFAPDTAMNVQIDPERVRILPA